MEKRTIEEEEARRPEALVPSGDSVFLRTTELLNVLIHQDTHLILTTAQPKKTTKTAGWNFIDFGAQVHETPEDKIKYCPEVKTSCCSVKYSEQPRLFSASAALHKFSLCSGSVGLITDSRSADSCSDCDLMRSRTYLQVSTNSQR